MLTGCVGTMPPEATVRDVVVEDVSDQGARLLVDLELNNPNPDQSVGVTTVRYRVRVGELAPYDYQDRAHLTLPPGGRQRVLLPASVAVPTGVVTGDEVRVSGSVVYVHPGEFRQILTDSGVPLPWAGFSQRDSLP